MDLSFSDEHQFLRESIRGTVEREAPLGKVRQWVLENDSDSDSDSGALDHETPWQIAARQGWTGIGIAEEQGGQGGEALELAILAEELGRGAVPADALYATLLAAQALSHSSAATEAADLIESLASGDGRAALVHPGDLAADRPLSDSAAGLVLGAAGATHLIAFTGAELCVYDADSVAALRTRRHVDRTRSLADVTLNGEPGAVYRLERPGTMTQIAARAAVMVAADALGAAERMLELTVEYVAERIQFGVPVGSFQAVKHTAAEMLVAIEGTRAAVEYAAWAVGAGEPDSTTDAWVAKARAARSGSFVADKALFLHGAVGYTWEHDLQLLFKRAKSDAELFGGAGAYDERIADSLSLTQPVSTSTSSPSRETVSA
jgi:alkylation response protein AidB-like acyl-CoA dehydrogenase